MRKNLLADLPPWDVMRLQRRQRLRQADRLQGQVRSKLARLRAFQQGLEDKARLYEERRRELQAGAQS